MYKSFDDGCGKWLFWSEIGSGFGQLCGTAPPQTPRNTPPPPPPPRVLSGWSNKKDLYRSVLVNRQLVRGSSLAKQRAVVFRLFSSILWKTKIALSHTFEEIYKNEGEGFIRGSKPTEKQVKARSRRPSAFIVSRCLEPLIKVEARVFGMTSQTIQYKKKLCHLLLSSQNERTTLYAATQSCDIT